MLRQIFYYLLSRNNTFFSSITFFFLYMSQEKKRKRKPRSLKPPFRTRNTVKGENLLKLGMGRNTGWLSSVNICQCGMCM
jgi:hypothetical protein